MKMISLPLKNETFFFSLRLGSNQRTAALLWKFSTLLLCSLLKFDQLTVAGNLSYALIILLTLTKSLNLVKHVTGLSQNSGHHPSFPP